MGEDFVRIPTKIQPGMDEYEVREVEYGSEDFKKLVAIRLEVFVVEQKVDEEAELDEYEPICTHLGIRRKGTDDFLSVCRLRPKPPFMKLERVATLKNFRGKGLAETLNNAAARIAADRCPRLILVAHAQSEALSFYRKLGFFVCSKEFLEEGIRHRTIVKVEPGSEYDISEYRTPAGIEFVPGECFDPEVTENIKEMIKGVQASRLVPLLTVLSVVEKDERLLGLAYPLFLRHARAVCYLQTFPEGNVENLEKDEKELLDLGWKKLNTGHYSQVGEHWRRFYFAVSLLKSIRLQILRDWKESLRTLDKGLMMGGRYLPKGEIAARTGFLQQQCDPHEELRLPETEDEKVPRALEGSVPVLSVAPMPDEDFFEKYLIPGEPVLIKGGVAHIPATRKWSLPFLAEKLRWRKFPVELGSRYTDSSWEQRLMSAEEFFFRLLHPDPEKGPVYLAQHRLFEQVPELLDDLSVPSYCLAAGLDEKDVDVNAWVGPAGTVSPLHTDPKDNLFIQVSGKKFVRLVSPKDSDRVYANDEGILTNTSQVDLENPDETQFPLVKGLRCLDVVVEAGDALFIPTGWWHFVRSLSPSISISFWFDNQL